MWFELLRRLGEARRHRLAGSAPRRPKVHNHRHFVACYVLIEVAAAQFDRMSGEQYLPATRTLGGLIEPIIRCAHNGIAMAADNMSVIGHERSLRE
jgi:hypothetical protein